METDWIKMAVSKDEIHLAKSMRVERDKLYGNIYLETSSDQRWVGDLGEIVFNKYLIRNNIGNFSWITDNAAGKPDFIVGNGTRIGVKTVKRQAAPKPNYTAQITAKHAHEPIDFFVFMSYDFICNEMYILGLISKAEFLNSAKYFKAGDQVHSSYTIREGHEIYNIELQHLSRIQTLFSKKDNNLISYRQGDLLLSPCKILLHGVNCQGKMGAGIALAVRKRYPEVYSKYTEYVESCNKSAKALLGQVQYVVADDKSKMICNCFTQEFYGRDERYTSYDAVDNCMLSIANRVPTRHILAMTKLGCVNGGGHWEVVEAIINHRLPEHNIEVYTL